MPPNKAEWRFEAGHGEAARFEPGTGSVGSIVSARASSARSATLVNGRLARELV